MVTIDIKLGLSWTVLSFGFFVICRHFARPLAAIRPSNTKTVSKSYIHTWLTITNDEQWARLNILISCLHSLIMMISVIYSFWVYSPDIYLDLVNHITHVTYFICCLSFGKLK
jgi:hypothetical protein